MSPTDRRRRRRDAQQGRRALARAERERTFAAAFAEADDGMKRTGLKFWPPCTTAQLLESKAEALVDERIAHTRHAFYGRQGPISACVFCPRPRRAHIHNSQRDYTALVREAEAELRALAGLAEPVAEGAIP